MISYNVEKQGVIAIRYMGKKITAGPVCTCLCKIRLSALGLHLTIRARRTSGRWPGGEHSRERGSVAWCRGDRELGSQGQTSLGGWQVRCWDGVRPLVTADSTPSWQKTGAGVPGEAWCQPCLLPSRGTFRAVIRCQLSLHHPWVGRIPWRRKWQPTSVFLPGKCHGWSILVGYIPGCL